MSVGEVPAWKTAREPFLARRWAAVTPHATTLLTSLKTDGAPPAALYIGTGGTIVCQGQDDVDVTFTVADGTVLNIMAKRVKASGTDATGIVALWP